jgi:hypothetical protein
VKALRLAILALAAALAAGFVVAALHRPGGKTAARLGSQQVSVRQTLSPRSAQFGDTVVATTDVLAREPVRLSAGFAPYRVVSTRRTVSRSGGVRLTHVTQRLRCLEPACVPAGSGTTFRFAPLRVSYGDGSRAFAWPALHVSSRVGAADVRRAVLRVPAPAPVLHPARHAFGWGLLVLAAALAAGGAALLLRLWLPPLRARRHEAPPLERALVEARASAADEPGRRRRALEALARELEPLDAPLSAESRVLAWAPPDPEPGAIEELTGRVQEALAL